MDIFKLFRIRSRSSQSPIRWNKLLEQVWNKLLTTCSKLDGIIRLVCYKVVLTSLIQA
jgi:hypothetical protein